MNAKIQGLFALVLLHICTSSLAQSLPKAIENSIPAGYRVLSFKSGDLNNDGRIDYLVALQEENEGEISERAGDAPRRPLTIFIQNADGTFTLAKRNDYVVFAADEGGQCDPFEDGEAGLALKGGYFTVQNSVACGDHWTDYITFHYIPELRDWVFHKRIVETWVMNRSTDPNADALVLGRRRVINWKKPFVLFEKYRPF